MEASQAQNKLFLVSIVSRHCLSFGGLPTLFEFSHESIFFILLPKGARRHTSSTAPDLSKKEFKKEKERLTTELHLLIQLRNEQRDHLIDFKESSNYNRTKPTQKKNPFYEQLRSTKNQVLSSVHKLEMGIIEAQENIQELNKWIDYFTNLHSQLLMEKNLKMSITQNQKNKEVEIDWALIEKYLVDLNLNGRTGADQQP